MMKDSDVDVIPTLDLSASGLTYDKIYSKTNFETDPQSKLSDEAKDC